ncbi:MAG: hypothetical protein IPL18_13665 [Sphingomonadales bacterium]|nr:hypothetical protein [Sphingomonadales bacterium]
MTDFEPDWPPDPPNAEELEALCTQQARASLALGRLDGLLKHCPPDIAHVFAAKLVRDTLTAALTQESHSFTEPRFAIWFAGLAPLSDEALQFARSARAVSGQLLAELALSRWEPLAETAIGFQAAFLAFHDANDAQAREAIQDSLAEARTIIASLPTAPLPFTGLEILRHGIAKSSHFALPERAHDAVQLDNLLLLVERTRPPSPRWPLEIAFGSYLRDSGLLSAALPIAGLIRQAIVNDSATQTRIAEAEALESCLHRLRNTYDQACAIVAEIQTYFDEARATSRAPQLYALLRAFGPLRSAQIEKLLGATRIGVRTMLASLAKVGVLNPEIICGVKLYSVRQKTDLRSPSIATEAETMAFSKDAIDAYDSSMADIDQLLARYSPTDNHTE